MFFDDWQTLWRTAIVGTCAYFALIFLLRISGKRTLSKMNAFDFVVTVALGSTLATILLSKQTALAEGVLALALLIFLQFIITWLSVRWDLIGRLVKAEPRLLYYQGEYLYSAMKRERVEAEEIRQALRSSGGSTTADKVAVVLETDGSMSVVSTAEKNREFALHDVEGVPNDHAANRPRKS